MITMNVNDEVWIKLTPEGEKLWGEYYDDIRRSDDGPMGTVPERVRKGSTTHDGYVKFQLWQVMKIFGSGCSAGMNPPFETIIRLSR